MSADMMIQALDNMISLQKSLTALAKQKTEIIKKGDIEALQSLIKEETKHLQAIRKIENQLVKETNTFIQQKGGDTESPTFSHAIEVADGSEKEQLLHKKTTLEKMILELQKQNQLNQELLETSLQFVNVSLDLLQPDIDAYNYDRSDQNQQESATPKVSLFDSKA